MRNGSTGTLGDSKRMVPTNSESGHQCWRHTTQP